MPRGGRLYAASADLDHWRDILGDFRLVHGHTHPQEGARMEDRERSLALNTSRYTSSRLGIGSLQNGKLSIHIVD